MYAVQVHGQTITRQWLRDQGAEDVATMIPGIADYDRAEFSDEEHATELHDAYVLYAPDEADNVVVVEL